MAGNEESGSESDERDFGLFIHHGGYFVKIENNDVYMKGYYLGIFDLDRKSFDFRRLNAAVKYVGYASWTKVYFRYPRTHNFVPIEGDEQVKEMLSILSDKISVLSVYVEGGVDDNSGVLQTRMTHHVPTMISCDGKLREVSAVDEDENIETEIDDGVVTQAVTEEDSFEHEGVENDLIVTEVDRFEHEGVGNEDRSEHGEGEDYQSGDENDDGLADEDLANDDPEYLEARKKARETKADELNRLMKDFILPEYDLEDEPQSEYEDSDGDLNSDSDEENVRFARPKVVYDPSCDHRTLEIVLGMRFQDGKQCRNALTTYNIENGKYVQFRKVSKTQCFAKCHNKRCPWQIYASIVNKDKTFVVKTYYGDHNCPRHMSNKLVSSKWIAARYLNVLRNKPLFSIDDLRRDINERWGYDIPKDRLYKGRAIAVELLRGTVEYHYSMIRRYTAELRRTDPEGRFELLLGDDHVFKGLYIGFSALIKGFKASCRPIIGLDGCHLKTYLGGVLLCAIGKDGNDQMFPIAWAAVEVENQECWTWFLKLLIHDMGLGNGDGYSFISDQQKGLENAVKELAPQVEHRNCSRHIYMNWKKEHKGSTLKNLFLFATRSTYEEKLKAHLLEMQSESMAAYHDFMSRDIKRFCKAFLSTSMCSDMIDNNIAETFNGWILNARGKHVIHMCEEIRTHMMVRQVKKRNEILLVNGRICPNIRKELEIDRKKSRDCIAKPNLDNKFEVNHFAEKFVVDVGMRTCTCRGWSLTGIPCLHALSAIQYMERDPTDYVHEYYTIEKYLKGYELGLQPINGERMWPEVAGYVVKPPALRRQAGRPKTNKRKRSAAEKEPRNPNKLPRSGMVMNCRKCGGAGHNRVKCQNMCLPPKPPKPKGKPGRPAKQPSAAGGRGAAASGSGGGRGACRGGGSTGRGQGIFARRGRGRAATFQAPRSAAGGTAHVMRERHFARGGGLYTSESTGNTYYSAPGSSVVRTIHHNDRPSTSGQHSTTNPSGS